MQRCLQVVAIGLLGGLGMASLAASEAWGETAPHLERGPLTVPILPAPEANYGRQSDVYHAAPRHGSRIRWHAAIPIWVPGVDGTFSVNGEEVEADKPADEILDWLFPNLSDLQFYFVGLVQARKGPWGITLDTFGGSIGNETTFRLGGRTLVDGRITAITPRGIVTRRILGRRWGATCVEAHAYVGARAYLLDLEASLPRGRPIFDESAWWVDPIVGVGFEASFGHRWKALVAADVGGFGAGSNLAWWVGARVGYQFSRTVGLSLGWTILDVDYTGTKSNGDRVDFDIQLTGPTLALTLDF
jgi:hypothetical protein